MILTSCSNSALNRLFSKQNILITDYGQEGILGSKMAGLSTLTRSLATKY
jgi:hypothetical protein